MSLKVLESFDWLESNDFPAGYGAITPYLGSLPQIVSGGRNGGNCLSVTPNRSANFGDLSGGGIAPGVAAGGEIIVGFSLKFTNVGTGAITFLGISSEIGTQFNLILVRTIGGVISVWSGATDGGGTPVILGTCKTLIAQGIWYTVEVKMLPHATTGYVEVRVNGIPELSLTNVDTFGSNNGHALVVFGANRNTPTILYDDVYICDDQGGLHDDFLGDCEVRQLKPNGNGNASDFVGSDGNSTDNYLLVDEAPAVDDDSTYTQSSTSGHQDLYTYGDLPAYATDVIGCEVKTVAKKVDAGAANLKAVCRSNAVESDIELGINTSYSCKRAIYGQNPDGPTGWTVTTLNAAEFGVERA